MQFTPLYTENDLSVADENALAISQRVEKSIEPALKEVNAGENSADDLKNILDDIKLAGKEVTGWGLGTGGGLLNAAAQGVKGGLQGAENGIKNGAREGNLLGGLTKGVTGALSGAANGVTTGAGEGFSDIFGGVLSG